MTNPRTIQPDSRTVIVAAFGIEGTGSYGAGLARSGEPGTRGSK